jgi:ribosomal protein S20
MARYQPVLQPTFGENIFTSSYNKLFNDNSQKNFNLRFFGNKLIIFPKKVVYMASRESVHEIQDIFLIINRENDSTHQKKVIGKNTKTRQKSKIEKAFAMQEKGMENAFKLF